MEGIWSLPNCWEGWRHRAVGWTSMNESQLIVTVYVITYGQTYIVMAAQENWPTKCATTSETVSGTTESKNKLTTLRTWDQRSQFQNRDASPLQPPLDTQKAREWSLPCCCRKNPHTPITGRVETTQKVGRWPLTHGLFLNLKWVLLSGGVKLTFRTLASRKPGNHSF